MHRCKTPHRAQATMQDESSLRACSLQVGADLRATVIERRADGFVLLQPVGDSKTWLKVSHRMFAQNWEVVT
jgi:hypothetical protein